MKKKETPQDKSALEGYTRDVCYVKNEKGEYETVLSKGWEVKREALDIAWDEVQERMEKAKDEIRAGKKSPIAYYMEKHLMDIQILSSYTGFWWITVYFHLKPFFFKRLSDEKLQRYAGTFEIDVEKLKNFNPNT